MGTKVERSKNTKLKRFLLPSICCSIKPLLGWIRRNQPEWKHFVSSGTRDWAVEMPGGESLPPPQHPVLWAVCGDEREAKCSMWSWVTGRWTWCESLYQAREPDRQWGFGSPRKFSLIWPLCCSRGQLGLSLSGLRQWRRKTGIWGAWGKCADGAAWGLLAALLPLNVLYHSWVSLAYHFLSILRGKHFKNVVEANWGQNKHTHTCAYITHIHTWTFNVCMYRHTCTHNVNMCTPGYIHELYIIH